MNNDKQIFQKVATGDLIVPIEDACTMNGEYSESYPIGFPIFDKAMKVNENDNGGVRDGDLIVITGISGNGKTTFAQNITLNLAKLHFPCLFFSYEVIVDNLYAKFKIMGYEDKTNIYSPKKNITGNIKWIKEKIIEAKEKFQVKVVIIDHIDYLSPANNNNSEQLRMRLRNITQELKEIALEQKVIIFLMAHTKKVEGRSVEMQDITESAGIYQLADYVFSVGRTYEKEEVNGQTINVALDEGAVRLLKNRLTGKMPYMKFKMENNIIKELRDEL